jgi:hypothetical protein
MSITAPVNLHFEESGEWYSLPEWAEYFISVGKQLASSGKSDSRIVTAIVLPTRAYAAAFVSLGMVVSDAAARDRTSEALHFQKLLDLPPETRVIYKRQSGKTLKGVLQGLNVISGKPYVRVQVHSKDGGSLTYNIDESHALEVQPARHSGKLPKKQGGANSRFANRFVEGLLGDADPIQLGLRSKICCAIVGRRNALEYEIRKCPLSLHTNGCIQAQGYLQDVLRIDRFVTAQQSYRSALVPVGTENPTQQVIDNVEMGVVFDGANGFLKWGSMWKGSHQVVILDRTETYFEDAISAINTRFSQNGSNDEATLPEIDIPAGGEALSFREALHKSG